MIFTKYLSNKTFIKHYRDVWMMLMQNKTGLRYSYPVYLVLYYYIYAKTNIPCEVKRNEEEVKK